MIRNVFTDIGAPTEYQPRKENPKLNFWIQNEKYTLG